MFYKDLMKSLLEFLCILALPPFLVFFFVALGFVW